MIDIDDLRKKAEEAEIKCSRRSIEDFQGVATPSNILELLDLVEKAENKSIVPTFIKGVLKNTTCKDIELTFSAGKTLIRPGETLSIDLKSSLWGVPYTVQWFE